VKRFTEDAMSDWMRQPGPDHDVVISSRVRLARNLRTFPFPSLATKAHAQEVMQLVCAATDTTSIKEEQNFTSVPMSQLSILEKRLLVEKHLISPHLAEGSSESAALINASESVSIMVNEEDHLRIQCIAPGFQLHDTWQAANRIDNQLQAQLDYAFNERLGYLTSCPTNVGTGIRVSVMVHLPGIVLTNQLQNILKSFAQWGVVMRGMYGEGSEALGNIYQMSNQITLGQSEEALVDLLTRATQQLILVEREARNGILNDRRLPLLDKIFRSFGTLLYAQMIDKVEAAQRLSDVRLGVDMGLLEQVPHVILDELLVVTQPGYLQQMEGRLMDDFEINLRRAQLIRERLWKHLR
jgi:protein arginine kinase